MPNRVPQKDEHFSSYINATANYLAEGTPTNADRLGLAPAVATEWDTKRLTYNPIYGKCTDPSQRTSTLVAQKNALKKAFTQFANPILTTLSANPDLTSDDRGVFKLPERDTPSARPEILDTPFAQISAMSGGNLRIRVRTTSDASRASMHRDADEVEVRYALVSASDPDDAIPSSVLDCTMGDTSTKAIFVLKLGPQHSGKRIYAFFRWKNAVNKEHSGPWGLAVQGVVV